MNIIKTGQQDILLTSMDSPFEASGIVSDGKDGFWVGETYSDVVANIYHVEAGAVTTKISLPAGKKGTIPSVNELLLADTTLWIADNNGVLYSFDTASSDKAAKVVHDLNSETSAFGNMVWDAVAKKLFYVDINTGTVHAFDTAKTQTAVIAEMSVPAKISLETINVKSLVAVDNKLWSVVLDLDKPTNNTLIRIDTSGASAAFQSYTIPDATAVIYSEKERQLYITVVNDSLNTNEIYIKNPADNVAPVSHLTVSGGSKLALNDMVIDAAGYLWCCDHSDDGKVYEINLKEKQVVAAYELQKTAAATNTPIPKQIIWHKPSATNAEDTFYVVDNGDNKRVIKLTPADAIDSSGNSTLTITATPPTETAEPGKKFGKFTVAITNTASKAPVEAPAVLKLEGAASDTHSDLFLTLAAGQAVNVPKKGVDINDLTAGAAESKFTLGATMRGMPEKTIFTGTIDIAVKELVVSDEGKKVAHSGDPITDVVTVDTGPTKGKGGPITLTIDSSTDATFKDGKKTATINPGDRIPEVETGKKAGDIPIKADQKQPDGTVITKTVTWYTKPQPAEIIVAALKPVDGSHLSTVYKNQTFKVLGYTINGDTTSALIPIADEKVVVEVAKEDVNSIEFVKGAVGSSKVVLTTNASGIANLQQDSYSLKNKSASAFRGLFHFAATVNVTKPPSTFKKDFTIRIQ